MTNSAMPDHQIADPGLAQDDSLLHGEWTAASPDPVVELKRWAVVGEGRTEVRASLTATGVYADAYPDFAALAAALDGGKAVDVVLVTPAKVVTGADAAAAWALAQVQTWQADDRFNSAPLVFITRQAVPVADDTQPADVAGASVWGVIKSAQAENPGRFILLDTDGNRASWRATRAAICTGEAQIAFRQGRMLLPSRMVTAGAKPEPKNRFADLTDQELDSVLLDLVHTNVASVLGHGSKDKVPVDAAFRDLGIDSMAAVDLRNRISAATGLELKVTMVFEYPSSSALAQHLKESLRSS